MLPRLFQAHFQCPTHYQRIAAFLVLTTVCPCFSIRAEGKPITDHARRRWVFSRLNLLLLPAVFELLNRRGNAPRWPGYPPAAILQQVVAFLELIDVSDLVEPKTFAHSLKGLAKDIAALSIIIQQWVELGPMSGNSDLHSLLEDTGLILKSR